jgi:hypothetical protein
MCPLQKTFRKTRPVMRNAIRCSALVVLRVSPLLVSRPLFLLFLCDNRMRRE